MILAFSGAPSIYMRNNPPPEAIAVLAAILAIFCVSVLVNAVRKLFRWVTVYNYQRGLLYRNGKLVRVLDPGRYLTMPYRDFVANVDLREAVQNVVNQELISADNLAIRLSSSVVYKIADPQLAIEQARSYSEVLYLDIQLVMREIVSGLKIEEVLEKRNELSDKLVAALKPKAALVGLSIESGGIKDITFPADVKRIFNQVAAAEKSAQASLSKSRAEVASMRALANAAKMMESNPNLLALRTLQSVSELANTSGNTIVLGVPSPMVPMPTAQLSKPDVEPENE